MLIGVHRVVAVFTAAAVFFTSIDCACATGLSSRQQVESGNSALAMPPCCAHHHGMAHHCKYQDGAQKRRPKPCDGTCDHCGQSVINDSVVARDLSSLSHYVFSVWDSASIPVAITPPAAFLRTPVFLDDLPPPAPAPTLLSLHCALNT